MSSATVQALKEWGVLIGVVCTALGGLAVLLAQKVLPAYLNARKYFRGERVEDETREDELRTKGYKLVLAEVRATASATRDRCSQLEQALIRSNNEHADCLQRAKGLEVAQEYDRKENQRLNAELESVRARLTALESGHA